jgi:hypothetical protein
MKHDRAAFALGITCLALSGLGFWGAYGSLDWRLIGTLAPVALVVIGVGMLLLTREKN